MICLPGGKDRDQDISKETIARNSNNNLGTKFQSLPAYGERG